MTTECMKERLNDEYPSAVLGMAMNSPQWSTINLSSGTKISSVRVKSLTEKQCDIVVTVGSTEQDTCDKKFVVTYDFNFNIGIDKGPMFYRQDIEMMKKSVDKLNSNVCGPKYSWLFIDPLALVILIVCAMIGYCKQGLGYDGTIEYFDTTTTKEQQQLQQFPVDMIQTIIIDTMFHGSVSNFFTYGIVPAYWFIIVAHGFEAAMTYNMSTNTLKLNTTPSIQWTFLVFLVGYPIFSRIQSFVNVFNNLQQQAQQQQKENKKLT